MRPNLITIPSDDPVHNPDNVPPEKIPVGYRLARKSEIDGKKHDGSKFWQRDIAGFGLASSEGWCLRDPNDTIIIPTTP